MWRFCRQETKAASLRSKKNNQMDSAIAVNLGRPVEKVSVLGGNLGPGATGRNLPDGSVEQNGSIEMPAAKNNEIMRLSETLRNVISQLNELRSDILAAHKEEIAKLSVQIARRILEQKIEQQDYEIESIVRQALEGVEVSEEVVVHLNPQDHDRMERFLKESQPETFKGVVFVADGKIAAAECVIQTPRGAIESLIEAKLERMAEALSKA